MAEDGASQQWDGFSIYSEVSRDIHESVGQAIDSYSAVQASHSEGAKVRREEAADHKAAILAAAHRLLTEMEVEVERGSVNSSKYKTILSHWTGDDDSDGWLNELHRTNLTQESPDWLHEFIREIHQAAWHLGYLKAGREESTGDSGPETSGREMIEDLAQNATSESNA